jgi:hypothetical protein
VILTGGTWDELGRWHSGSAWSDLHRTVLIALRRSTESELVEVLSASVGRADDVGRLAAWRLWRLIRSRPDAHPYARRREVRQADRVTRWDQASRAERERIRTELAERRAAAERLHQARLQAAAAREERYRRWGLRWTREPEHVQQEQHGLRPPPTTTGSYTPQDADRVRAAALAMARAEKRARKGKGGR